MLEYRRLSSSDEDCRIVDAYFNDTGKEFSFSQMLKRLNRHCKTNDIIGVGLFDEGKICGFIGIMIWPVGEKTVSCLTTGSILPQYRGKGIGKELFNQAIENAGDVIVDFSPTENVYQMLLNKFDGWHPYFKYQLWINCSKIPSRNSIIIETNYKLIEKEVTDPLAQLVRDHENTTCKFALIKISDCELLIGYRVAYKSKIFSTLEIIYVSDNSIFDQNLETVAKAISEVGKKKYVFVDSCFFDEDRYKGVIEENCAGSKLKKAKRITKLFFKKEILAPSRRICYEKSGEGFQFYKDIGYLYSELCLEEKQ